MCYGRRVSSFRLRQSHTEKFQDFFLCVCEWTPSNTAFVNYQVRRINLQGFFFFVVFSFFLFVEQLTVLYQEKTFFHSERITSCHLLDSCLPIPDSLSLFPEFTSHAICGKVSRKTCLGAPKINGSRVAVTVQERNMACTHILCRSRQRVKSCL